MRLSARSVAQCLAVLCVHVHKHPWAAATTGSDWVSSVLEGLQRVGVTPRAVPPAPDAPAPSASDYYDYLVRRAGEVASSEEQSSDWLAGGQAICERRWEAPCYGWYRRAAGAVTPPIWPDVSGNNRTLRPEQTSAKGNVSRASGGMSLKGEATVVSSLNLGTSQHPWTTCITAKDEAPCEGGQPCILWTFNGAGLLRLGSQLVLRAGGASVEFEGLPAGSVYAACVSASPVEGTLLLGLNAGTASPMTGLVSANYVAPPQAQGLRLGPTQVETTFYEVVQLSKFLEGALLGRVAAELMSHWAKAPPSPAAPGAPAPPPGPPWDYTDYWVSPSPPTVPESAECLAVRAAAKAAADQAAKHGAAGTLVGAVVTYHMSKLFDELLFSSALMGCSLAV